jgi:hypothetical protein
LRAYPLMSDSYRGGPDYVQNALEATCDALMTLESIRGAPGARGYSSELQVTQAIASLRQAISELRLARGNEESMVALGFVVGTAPERRDQRPRSQARPRRTA